MDTNVTTIDEYIKGFPADTQAILAKIRGIIRKTAPQAAEKIGYGIPTFTLRGNLVHFGGYDHHIGFYPTPGVISAFKDKLVPYETAKGSVKFPLDRPIPYDLIEEMTQYRVKRVMAE